MSGSKYTNPTGDGYLGVWKAGASTLEVAIGTFEAYPWQSDTIVYVLDTEYGIALVEASDVPADSDYLAEANVFKNTVGTCVRAPGKTLSHIDGFEPGCDVRAYERDAGGMHLVAKAADPFVATEDGDRDA